MEKLIVKNFLVVGSAELLLNRINIFIGPQAQGKSVLTKLIYFFKGFPFSVADAGVAEKSKREFDQEILSKFESIFPKYAWDGREFFIRYESSYFWVELSNERVGAKLRIKMRYCEELTKALTSARKSSRKNYSEEAEYSNNRFRLSTDVRACVISSIFGGEGKLENVFYIPAGRSFFANLQKTVFSFISTSAPIDYFLKEFGALYERSRDEGFLDFLVRNKNRPKGVNRIVEDLICGKYLSEKGQDWIVGVNGKINVANSSSGQQEALPLAMVLSSWPYINPRQLSRSFIIEEPEAHLFPVAQGQVVALIASAYNGPDARGNYIITTHSPYILTAFNNLIQAGNVSAAAAGRMEKLRELYAVVPKEQVVRFEDVAAYYVNRGSAHSIIDEDLRLIDANAIDGVSDVFSARFEKLVEMEVGGDEYVHNKD